MKNVQVYLKEIKKDVLKSILYDLFHCLRWFVLTIIAMIVELAFFPEIPFIALSTIPFFIEAALYVVDACILIIGKKIVVTTDVLSDKKEHQYRPFDGSHRPAIPARLSFNYEGHYNIPYDLAFYRWSSISVMDEKHLFETSCIGDTFTVVKIRNKIRAVYNHRFFDVQYPET